MWLVEALSKSDYDIITFAECFRSLSKFQGQTLYKSQNHLETFMSEI